MPRGGRRAGKPGAAYPNRTDLPTAPDPGAGTFKGQPYGAATQQAAVAASGGPPAPPNAAMGQQVPMIPPGAQGAFNRPSERPDEPLTHGLPIGPGGGPEVLGLSSRTDSVALQLRALYQKFPIPEIGALLSEL